MQRRPPNIQPLPDIDSIDELAFHMHLDSDRLRTITISGSRYYLHYLIPKRNGKHRLIRQPSFEIKGIQSWILREILDKLFPSSYATAFLPRTPLIRNAIPHINNRYLLSIDLIDFFDNVKFESIYHVFTSAGYSNEVAWALSRLCTCDGSLPQGGITSPALSNLVSARMDKRIGGLCSKYNFCYTRYADDITVSSNNPERLKLSMRFIRRIIRDEGFSVNDVKTKLMGPDDRCEITGLVKSNERQSKIGVGNKKKRLMRSIIYRHAKGLTNTSKYTTNESIHGWLSFLRSVEPESYHSFMTYWEKLNPDQARQICNPNL